MPRKRTHHHLIRSTKRHSKKQLQSRSQQKKHVCFYNKKRKGGSGEEDNQYQLFKMDDVTNERELINKYATRELAEEAMKEHKRNMGSTTPPSQYVIVNPHGMGTASYPYENVDV